MLKLRIGQKDSYCFYQLRHMTTVTIRKKKHGGKEITVYIHDIKRVAFLNFGL